jgi:hypothetical protein
MVKPIDRAIQFADKFPDVILDKTQLQRFLGSLNYVADFYQIFESIINLYMIGLKAILLLGQIFILLLSNKLKHMSRLCPVLAFLILRHLKLLKLMPPTLDMVAF